MLIDKLVDFCNKSYQLCGKCSKCLNTCQGSCEKCLDAIHFSKIDRPYNCCNIANFYVCKYIYKYSSEIYYLIKELKSLRKYEEYNIVSIGCGPCTELAGILNYLIKTGRERPVNYVGFDMNKIWQPIHKEILAIVADYPFRVTVRFFYADAYKMINRLLDQTQVTWRPNLLILQYVLSDLVKSKINVNDFLSKLNENIVPRMPINSYILLNDINHNIKARDYFDKLEKMISKNHRTWVFQGHFHNNNKQAYEYGQKHKSNLIMSRVPTNIRSKYNPWEFCSSAQMVVKKRD